MTSILEGHAHTKIDLAAEVLRRRGKLRMKAWGASMLPSVWPGDVLTIHGAESEEFAAGDIVLVLRGDRFFVHRLVGWRLSQDCLLCVTRGDAMPHDDPPSAAAELLGRVAKIHRGNRSLVPSRRVSPPHAALAWILFRWGGLRNLSLRIHALRSGAGSEDAEEFIRNPMGRVGPLTSSTRGTSHS